MTAERDKGVTDGDCWICNPPDPGPCPEHGGRADRCKACVRQGFAEWLARVGPQRLCNGSRLTSAAGACPGCAACATAETPCPAFADGVSTEACVFCGEAAARHRPIPDLPDDFSAGSLRGFARLGGEAPPGAPILIMKDPR